MAKLHKSWLMALGLGTAFMFFAQVLWCAADDTGMVSCSQTSSQNDRGSLPATSGENPVEHNCHCLSHASLLPAAMASGFTCDTRSRTFFDRNDFAPEAPVAEIEYPPQLS